MNALKTLLKDRKGQNTVEYMMMLAMVVGVALITGAAIKKFMPNLFGQIEIMVRSAVGTLGQG